MSATSARASRLASGGRLIRRSIARFAGFGSGIRSPKTGATRSRERGSRSGRRWYEIVGTGLRWEGHAGARAFYGELFAAFPDNTFALTDIVIGPQGVFEAVVLEATHQAPFAGLARTGRRIRLELAILFPWDPATQLFSGEQIFIDRTRLVAG